MEHISKNHYIFIIPSKYKNEGPFMELRLNEMQDLKYKTQ